MVEVQSSIFAMVQNQLTLKKDQVVRCDDVVKENIKLRPMPRPRMWSGEDGKRPG